MEPGVRAQAGVVLVFAGFAFVSAAILLVHYVPGPLVCAGSSSGAFTTMVCEHATEDSLWPLALTLAIVGWLAFGIGGWTLVRALTTRLNP